MFSRAVAESVLHRALHEQLALILSPFLLLLFSILSFSFPSLLGQSLFKHHTALAAVHNTRQLVQTLKVRCLGLQFRNAKFVHCFATVSEVESPHAGPARYDVLKTLVWLSSLIWSRVDVVLQ